MNSKVRVTVTGAAGQIGYALLFRIASGQMFGENTKIELTLLEVESALKATEGVVMELEDSAFPLLESINVTSNLDEGFHNTNWALLVGAMARKAGMERKDLLSANGKIFMSQGKAIEKNAADDVRILVIGNPCNTNCLIARNNAKEIPSDRWFAMTKLDENRAKAQLSQKSNFPVSKIKKMAIWGNHSATQYPDFYNAQINDQNAIDVIQDIDWLQNNFITTVQQRGAAIIKARGLSSAASAANGVIDTVRSLINSTPIDDFFSIALCSDGSYGIEKDLIFSFPVSSDGKNIKIIQDLSLNDFSKQKIKSTENELKEERQNIQNLL